MLPKLILTTNKQSISNQRIFLRQSEKGLVLPVQILDDSSSPFNLDKNTVEFKEDKSDGKSVVDANTAVTDAANGIISYPLHSQAYVTSGTAWFEVLSPDGTVIDSTQSFSIMVEQDINPNVDDSDYIATLENLKQKMQTIVDSASGEISDKLTSIQNAFDAKISDMESVYTSAEQKRQDAYNTAESSRNTDWTTYKKGIDDEWSTLKTSLDGEISTMKTSLTSIQASIDTLNKTTLPGLNADVTTVSDKVDTLKTQLADIDWSSYVKTINGQKPDTNGDVAIDLSGTVKSVNSIKPDATGNVTIDTGAVKSVNTIKPDSTGNVQLSIPDAADFDPAGSADTALNSAKNYTDSQISGMNLTGYQKTWTGTLADYQSLTSYSDDTMYYILSGYDVVVK